MNIGSYMTLNAGGPGSGPHAPCPQCGPAGHSGGPHKQSAEDKAKIPMGKSPGLNIAKPQIAKSPHAGKYKFTEDYTVHDKKAQTSTTWHTFHENPDASEGTSVRTVKTRTGPNSARLMVEEIKWRKTASAEHHDIIETHMNEFKSGKDAKSFLQIRYGINSIVGKNEKQ